MSGVEQEAHFQRTRSVPFGGKLSFGDTYYENVLNWNNWNKSGQGGVEISNTYLALCV